jgi:DNA polymerase-4
VTVAEAQQRPAAELERRLGARAGRWLADRVWGVDPSPVVAGGPAKQVSRETTFAHDLADQAALERELLQLVVRVSADLRAGGREARTVTVKVRDRQFRTRTGQRTLPAPVASEQVVFRVAQALFRQLHPTGAPPLRLVGVALSHLDGAPEVPRQLGLFAADEDAPDPAVRETPRDRALTAAVDRIRARFGTGAILPAPLVGPSEAGGPRVEE